jgi:EpsI family protein
MRPMSSWRRFVPVLALLAGTALLLGARNRAEILPPRMEITSFPKRIGNWVGTDQPLPADVLAVLGPGEFLQRSYQRSPNEPPIGFFLAYFPSQRSGDTIHSPKNCLPGAGWAPIESARMQIIAPGGGGIPTNRYVIAKGMDRQLVLYWYQAHGRAVASEYWAKFYLVVDAIRLNRSDGALVRVVTPLAIGESEASAQQRAVEFARSLLRLLDGYIPR